MTAEEIRLRRLAGQHLTAPAPMEQTAGDLCGIQAQFFGGALDALRIRCGDFDEKAAGEKLVKNWTLRGTMHLFPREDLSLYLSLCDSYWSNEWTQAAFWNQRPGWALTPQRQKLLSDAILGALESGERTREELKAVCRAQGMTPEEEGSMFDPWGGGIRELCQRGFVHCAAREGKVYCLTPEIRPMEREKAELELARRYFANYGPATVRDAMYFFRATKKQVLSWLEKLPVRTLQAEARTYYFLAEDREWAREWDREPPNCLFLPGFDPLMLGYEKKESLFLPEEYLRGIFNLAGIVLPALLINGTVAGRWKEKNGVLTVEAFRELTREEKQWVALAADARWQGLRKLTMERK